MNRRHMLGLTGLGLAAPALLRARTPKLVLIIGAGAAGLTAAHHLRRAGQMVQIIDAAPQWGGRIAELTGLADFPIDIGAEWLHDGPEMLGKILGQGPSSLGIRTIDYRPQSYQIWSKGRLKQRDDLSADYAEVKFYRSTWHSFFASQIVAHLGDALTLNAKVRALSHDRETATATLDDGRQISADQILVTLPLSMLQNGSVSLPLSKPKSGALRQITFGEGFKAFLKFREAFYPDILIAGSLAAFQADSWEEKTYYNAAFGKDSPDHILGLFTASQSKIPRTNLSDKALIADILAELDQIYAGAASKLFLGGVVQNWSRAPHILGSYSMDNNADLSAAEILAPQNHRLFFAGEALGGDHQSTVHGAAYSAIAAVEQMLA